MEIFKKRIKELRSERNLTLREIGEALGIDHTTYSSYETGKAHPKLELFVKIAEFFDVTPNYLLGVDDV